MVKNPLFTYIFVYYFFTDKSVTIILSDLILLLFTYSLYSHIILAKQIKKRLPARAYR